MESMRWQQQPLPCEVCDVSTAVFDGTDGLVLTSATSIGSNPVQVNLCLLADCFFRTEMVEHAAYGITKHALVCQIDLGSHCR